jgi:hypothetical protein
VSDPEYTPPPPDAEKPKPARKMRGAVTLDEAMAYARSKRVSKPRTGGLSRDDQTFEQYFIDAVRNFMGKKPLYHKDNASGRAPSLVRRRGEE